VLFVCLAVNEHVAASPQNELAEGSNIRTVQEVLGHSAVRTTMMICIHTF
jgi:site-specific recombinase XerD